MAMSQTPRHLQRRKRPRVWKVILIMLLILVPGVVLLLVMMGLMPGLSPMVGTTAPRDLGVAAEQKELDRVLQEIETMFWLAQNGPAKGVAKPFDQVFTEGELTALLQANQLTDFPVHGGQIRIHADGMLEISVGVATGDLPPEVAEYVPPGMPEILPLYVKGRLFLVGTSELKLEIQRAEVGRLPLPLSLFGEALQGLTDGINEELRWNPGLRLERLTFEEGKVRLQGTTTS